MTPPKCERDGCDRAAWGYARGKWACADHLPAGSVNCGHSLIGDGRCSYCGATVTLPPVHPDQETLL